MTVATSMTTERTPTEDTLVVVHRDVERAMGQLCLALTRRKVSRGAIIDWSATLREAARQLDQLNLERGNNG